MVDAATDVLFNRLDDLVGVCNLPSWGPLFEAYNSANGFIFVEQVVEYAMKTRAQIYATPHWVDVLHSNPSIVMLNVMSPNANIGQSLSLDMRRFFVDCLHGILAVALIVAVAAAGCALSPWMSSCAALPSAAEARLALLELHRGEVGEAMAMGENTPWKISVFDVHAMLGPSLDWSLAEWATASRAPSTALEAFLDRGRKERWLREAQFYIHTSGSSLPPPPLKALRVAVALYHHGEFQETSAILQRSLRLTGSAEASVEAVHLNARSTRGALSFGGHAPPESLIDYQDMQRSHASLGEAQTWFRARAAPLLRTMDLVLGCMPVYVCALLHVERPDVPVLVHLNMALLEGTNWADLSPYWPLLTAFLQSPRVALAASNGLVAEQVVAQTGARFEYVPFAGAHVQARHSPGEASDVLIWKCAHPSARFFGELIQHIQERNYFFFRMDSHQELLDQRGPLPYEDVARYRAVVLLPHVPNPVALSDLYAMGIPLFVPDQPGIFRFLWDYDDCFAGPSARPQKRERAALRDSAHPHDPLDFLSSRAPLGRLAAQAYWYQFTEFALLPALQRFRGVVELTQRLSAFSIDDATKITKQMRVIAAWRADRAARSYAYNLASILA